ncbi:Nuclease-related domain-containing protein [Parafrankia irregularis]|uniref:Nuclease-related domain-containing protein n=1 Tax=Parafrankia irregularis TaxID=795642 RepID=A0A0S4QQC1_9ACTN|nr:MULTISPECIES: nuclease-related domain-containing protein [Parafrankia]MBE3204306.1 NERD domain-containing protein [Parafrankia sp. CH37]CUU57278.1 Nuclease-related domain-containing protein [Parafrankia irregularis]
MAEYQRRRQLYAAERGDRSRRVAVVAAVGAAGAGALAGFLCGLGGLPAVRVAQAAVLGALVVLGAFAIRYYRVPPEIEAWRLDAEAERRTARSLDRLGRAGYTVLHDRQLADSAGNIDHLVIGPSGAWVIETDTHGGPIRQNPAGVWAGKVPLRAMLGLVAWMGEEATSQLVAELPAGWQLEAQSVVAFARAEVPDGLALVDGVLLLPVAGVADYILAAGVVLRPIDVALLVDVAQRVLPGYEVAGPQSWPTRSRLRGMLRR